MMILIGEILIMIGLLFFTTGLVTKIDEKLSVPKGKYIAINDSIFIDKERGPIKIEYLVLRDINDKSKPITINTEMKFEIKEQEPK